MKFFAFLLAALPSLAFLADVNAQVLSGGDWAAVSFDGNTLECKAVRGALVPANTIVSVFAADGALAGSVGCESGKGETRRAMIAPAYPLKLQVMVMFGADSGVKGFTPTSLVANHTIADAGSWSPSQPFHVIQPFDLWKITVTSDASFVFNAKRAAQSIAPYYVGFPDKPGAMEYAFGGSIFVRAGGTETVTMVAPRSGGISGDAQFIAKDRIAATVTFGGAGAYVVKDKALTPAQ